MVLVSNEWQNKCEDEPKTTATTATTAGTTATTATGDSTTTTSTAAATIVAASISIPATVVNSAIESETIVTDSINYIPTISSSTTIIETLENDNVNNERIIKKDKNSTDIVVNNNKLSNDIDDNNVESKNTEVEKNSLTACNIKLKEEQFEEESFLNYNNIQKIMAENTKETPSKEEHDANNEDIHELITNNLTEENNKDLDESNSYPNSNTNTNTLQAPESIKIRTQNNQQQNIITQQQQQQQVPLSCPITPQALSSALQSALNATNNANNSVQAAAGLQPNFLSQLAFTANVAGLQNKTTAKQLNQSFNTGLDAATIQTAAKNDSNLLDASAASTAVPVAQQQTTYESNGQSKIVLICEGNSHPFQTRNISLTPNVECMVGRLIAKSKASESNAIFDCKVLSRKHAVIWYTPDGKFWVKDTKSSNGTFINDNKLGDEEAELHFGDIVKFGVDVLENSRKEVHGCIIACVKLYLPDGREAISIDSSASHRSQYSGEGRISYDELHRLNHYIQETSQREKVLTSKLCSIQNILDATRKNSALCWQSMITEDQLLHRIHSLEKKLQFMEKNVPENLLRNEVLKLLDDKSSYQHTAKEAIRKVYQERCDAMQMLAKMESAYTQSDNECSLLRDQIMNSKQTLQDVNARLLRLETEYNEYKDDIARLQKEAKEREEQRIADLTEKLRERELECEELKNKISELLIKRDDLLDDEEQLLEKQAIEKLDEVIGDMDLGDDENDDDDDEDSYEEEDDENKRNFNDRTKSKAEDVKDASPSSNIKKQSNSSATKPHITSIFGDNLNGLEMKERSKEKSPKLSKLKKSKAFDSMKQKTPPKRVRESTIMKWLQNSDLNKNEGSFDIFKAICNENDEDSSEEDVKENKTSIVAESSTAANEFSQKCTNFSSKLKNVQKNLKQLEAEIENEIETETETCGNITAKLEVGPHTAKDGDADEKEDIEPVQKDRVQYIEDDSSDEDNNEGAAAGEEFFIKRNGKSTKTSSSENKVLSKENKKYQLLKSSVNMLREAYNEIWDSVREQEEQTRQKQQEEDKEFCDPFSNTQKTQSQSQQDTSSQTKQKPVQQILRFDNDITGESDSEVESLTLSSPVNSSHRTVIDIKSDNSHILLKEQLKEYQSQVGELNGKLQQTELEAQHTLEIMQVECDEVKQKMENLNEVIISLTNDKLALEHVINENKNNTTKLQQIEITTMDDDYTDDNSVHEQLEKELEDLDLQAINVIALEREEELITYKERLDEQQKENIELRNEIANLKLKANTTGSTKDVLLKQFLPYGFVVIAIIVYFLTTYF